MDPEATFLKRFGDLVALLRYDPGNDAAQDLALTAAAAAVAHGPVRIDVGIETSAIPDPRSLQARLLAHQIEAVLIAADVDLSELLALARALAHDATPLLTSAHIQIVPLSGSPTHRAGPPEPPPPVSSAPAPAPSNRRLHTERRASSDRRRCAMPVRWSFRDRRSGADRRASGERRLALLKDVREESARLYGGFVQASRRREPEDTLYALLALARMAVRVPQAERRGFVIQIRRLLQRSAIEAIVDHAERDPAARAAAVDVLLWLGLDAAEVMLERLRVSPVLGPKAFFLDVLGRMPGVYPMIVPLLRSTEPHHIRHGAAIAARLGNPDAASLLARHLDHPDTEARNAAIRALGWLHEGDADEPLRAALRHPSPSTRAAAAQAIAMWRGGTLGFALSGAIATEQDRGAWLALVDALGQLGTAPACATLAAIARSQRSLLHRRGYTRDQRLAAVAALTRADSSVAYRTLQVLARSTDNDVRAPAQSALAKREQGAAVAVS